MLMLRRVAKSLEMACCSANLSVIACASALLAFFSSVLPTTSYRTPSGGVYGNSSGRTLLIASHRRILMLVRQSLSQVMAPLFHYSHDHTLFLTNGVRLQDTF